MKIIVKAKTSAKKNSVERVGQPTLLPDEIFDENRGENAKNAGNAGTMVTYKVSVTEAPVAGRANEAIVRALAEYFDVSPSSVRLVTGQTSKQKIFEIMQD